MAGAVPGLWVARGQCRGPFPLDKRGRPIVHGGRLVEGRVVVPGSLVLNDPRFNAVLWDRCPVAAVGHSNCPAPDVAEPWIGTVFDVANWVADGRPLRDLVDEPTDLLREAVMVVRREANKMDEKSKKSGG